MSDFSDCNYNSDSESGFPTAQYCRTYLEQDYKVALRSMKSYVRRNLFDQIKQNRDFEFEVELEINDKDYDFTDEMIDYVIAFLSQKGYNVELKIQNVRLLTFSIELPE